ncbi:CRAL/TRIO domain-containing protein [Pilatotrama ljubarskyi]|nr:CRAL/TRIO domain-containing protein [Pilatotrama ljubarskyi]
MSAVLETLRAQEERLAETYGQNIESARGLQFTLLQDILPGLVVELGLEADDEERARFWLEDLQSIFRMLRRHKFTVPFALEHARDTLLWRLAVLPAEIPPCPSWFLRCLPLTCRDPFGRPVVVVKLARIFDFTGDAREALVQYMELLRLNLQVVNEAVGDQDALRPLLQYTALLDIGGISVQKADMDLVPWYLFELVPRFPGMLAAVFILNYSWAHSGVWSIVKRVLPKSALSRVFFPSQDELLQIFSPSALPQEYGGSLPPLSELEDPLRRFTVSPLDPSPSYPSNSVRLEVPPVSQPISRVPSISPTSHLNPYFGYPVSRRDAITPRLRHGRQRKRDLLRTLASLWWGKWKHRVYALLCIVLAFVMIASRRSPRVLRWKQGLRRLLDTPPGSR